MKIFEFGKKDKAKAVGGQAVIEGVMMKGAEILALPVRKLDGENSCQQGKGQKQQKGYFQNTGSQRYVLPFV